MISTWVCICLDFKIRGASKKFITFLKLCAFHTWSCLFSKCQKQLSHTLSIYMFSIIEVIIRFYNDPQRLTDEVYRRFLVHELIEHLEDDLETRNRMCLVACWMKRARQQTQVTKFEYFECPEWRRPNEQNISIVCHY